MEYHFDSATSTLFFLPNATTPVSTSTFVATKTQVLFNLSGSRENTVRDVTIANLTIRDAATTELEPHGMPSGGDWSLQHTGAITITGAEQVTIASVRFIRNDGNGVFLHGYTRNVTVADADFEWQGDSCVASWGSTSSALNANGSKALPNELALGPDGREGNHPLGTQVLRTAAHDMGICTSAFAVHPQCVLVLVP